MSIPVLFSGSPRAGGNSDHAVDFFGKGIVRVQGDFKAVRIRKYNIHPCIACYRCRHDPQRGCFLANIDQSDLLFKKLLECSFVFFAAPIYFYHLPSQLKAFIDRSQSYYLAKEDNHPLVTNLPPRKAYLALFAGRPRGESLFEGSILSLKYFLKTFNFELQEPMVFRGMDNSLDLARSQTEALQLQQAGEAAWEKWAGQNHLLKR